MPGLSLNGSNASGAAASESTPLTTTTVSKSTARLSFLSGDAQASRFYHENKHQDKQGHAASEEGHQSEGGFLKPIIFGGLDGILTSFAIVAGAAGGRLDPSVVLILGFR
jgi:DNA damage-binding protein 1